MISNTSLKSRIKRKTNPVVKDIIAAAMKEKGWRELAQILSGSTRKYSSLNLSQISEQAKESIVVIPGKVLSSGNLSKKVSIYALSLSNSAMEKISNSKGESGSILDIIKKNPKATGVQIIR